MPPDLAYRTDPRAALFFYSRDCGGEHRRQHLAGWAGILQAGAYAGFGELYEAKRQPAPITEAPAGATAGANSSNWPIFGRRRWRAS